MLCIQPCFQIHHRMNPIYVINCTPGLLLLILLLPCNNIAEAGGGWCSPNGAVVAKSSVVPWARNDKCNTCECYRGGWDCTYDRCVAGPIMAELGSFQTSTYFLLRQEKNWDRARGLCQRDDGDLVVIDSEAEWKFLLEAVKSKGEDDELWMGASASSGYSGPWEWLDGRSFSKDDAHWEGWGPNDNGRACLVLSGWRGETNNWMDFDCNWSSKAVCEKTTVNITSTSSTPITTSANPTSRLPAATSASRRLRRHYRRWF